MVALMLSMAGTGHGQTDAPAGEGGHGSLSSTIAGCVACHGQYGTGSIDGVPRLAGQNPDYMAHALSMFRARSRAGAAMQAVAQSLSDAEMRDVATYFASQNPPLLKGQSVPPRQLVAAGKQMAERGAGDNVAACFSCHGAGGLGNGARFPRIAAQPRKYIVDRLHEFQARASNTNPAPGTMTAVAAALTEQQIEQAAAYLSVTHDRPPRP
jgi:cytochrome c553